MGKVLPERRAGVLGLWVAALLLGSCGSKQLPLTPAEDEVEQKLNAYVQQLAGCRQTWWQQHLPWLFRARCSASLSCYTGLSEEDMQAQPARSEASFYVSVADNNRAFCEQDSSQLKQQARYFARQMRPALPPAGRYTWINVKYSSCIPIGKEGSGCSQECWRTIRFSVADTSTWAAAVVHQWGG
ncbi:hypothetical protein [Hymenobacter chitinivorans]|uniref:Lipoprotein n=1 Tax=Hymenobacter chitinivorans DSM 11115 TaxID=1121954 RepID=A0A2M9BS41_9BACT|nr:hypothetical protein [Hymenobacter chitinivorans]PJJ60763.1 hypothetical protein CLV45_2194 [Hymenobacter chitinivorans DSM 11115]